MRCWILQVRGLRILEHCRDIDSGNFGNIGKHVYIFKESIGDYTRSARPYGPISYQNHGFYVHVLATFLLFLFRGIKPTPVRVHPPFCLASFLTCGVLSDFVIVSPTEQCRLRSS